MDNSTTRLLDAYMEGATPNMFLSSFFQTPPQNFHRSENVSLDVIRSEPHLAIPVKSVGTGAREVEATKFTNKEFVPPVYDLETTISAFNGLKRQPGDNPFEDPDFLGAAVGESFTHMRHLEGMIRRGVELQASQILQGNVISLTDAGGVVIYTEDFKVKSAQHITAGTTWAIDGSTGDPLGDLDGLAVVVRQNGKLLPDRLIFGNSAFQRFAANVDVKSKLDNRRMDFGGIKPSTAGNGATFQGRIWIGNYEFEMWTYDETFIHPQNPTTHVRYVTTDKVIMMSSGGRLDLTFGELPMFIQPEARAQQFLPPRMSSSERGLDLTTNAWVTPDGKHLKLSAGTRPLCIPTAVDTFGSIDVTA